MTKGKQVGEGTPVSAGPPRETSWSKQQSRKLVLVWGGANLHVGEREWQKNIDGVLNVYAKPSMKVKRLQRWIEGRWEEFLIQWINKRRKWISFPESHKNKVHIAYIMKAHSKMIVFHYFSFTLFIVASWDAFVKGEHYLTELPYGQVVKSGFCSMLFNNRWYCSDSSERTLCSHRLLRVLSTMEKDWWFILCSSFPPTHPST